MIDLQDVLECVNDLIKKLKNLLTFLTEIKEDFEFMQGKNEAIDDDAVRACMEDIYNKLMIKISAIYSYLPNIAYYASGIRSCYGNPVEHAMSDRLVSVLVNGNDVYIKVPLLRKKHSRVDSVFDNELRMALDNCRQLPQYKKSIIRIVHVYNSGFKIRHIPDNDNVDIKKTIDAIADYITGSDHALNTTIVLQSIYTDEIEQGTYIHVSKNEDDGAGTQCCSVDLQDKDIYFIQLQKGDEYNEKGII